jgi:hypothetical protein
MAKFEGYPPKNTLADDDIILISDSEDLDTGGDGKTKGIKESIIFKEQPNGFNNLALNGGFDINQRGFTTTISNDIYTFDMIKTIRNSATFNAVVSSFSSKKNALEIVGIGTTGDGFKEIIHGNILSELSCSYMMYYTLDSGSLSSLNITLGSTTIVDTTPSKLTGGWVRVDVPVALYATGQSLIQCVFKGTSANVTVEYFRVIDTPTNLPANIVPEWIKQNEDILGTLLKVQAYCWILDGNNAPSRTPMNTCNYYFTTQCFFTVPHPVPMIRPPTPIVSSATAFDITVLTVLKASTASDVVETTIYNFQGRATTAATANGSAGQASLKNGDTIILDAGY